MGTAFGRRYADNAELEKAEACELVRLVQFLIIPGVMKCGTSTLFHCLAAHPEVCPSHSKEPEFFSSRQSHGNEPGSYLDIFAYDQSVHRVLLDGSTGYSKPGEEDVPEAMRDFGIDPYFVFVLRNPFERIVSHVNHRRRYHDDPRLTDYVISFSEYWRTITRFTRIFDRVRVTTLENLTRDSEEIISIQKFAGLTPQNLPLEPENVGVYNDSTLVFSTDERAAIHERLAPDMVRLQEEFGVDVSRWGFG